MNHDSNNPNTIGIKIGLPNSSNKGFDIKAGNIESANPIKCKYTKSNSNMPYNRDNTNKTPYTTFLFNDLSENSLIAKYARVYNRSFLVVQFLSIILCFIALESTLNVCGFATFLQTHFMNFANIVFILICVYLVGYMFAFYKAGHEYVTQDRMLICECVYQRKWYQKIVSLYMTIFSLFFCLLFSLFAYFSQNVGILALPLYIFVKSKSFLLQKILVYENKLVLQYRLYGDICIDIQNIGIASSLRVLHNSFVGLFHIVKHKDYILCYHLIGLNLIGLFDKQQLIKAINKQSGFDMEHHTKISFFGLKRDRV